MGTQETLPPSVVHSVKGLPKHSCWGGDAACFCSACTEHWCPGRQWIKPSIYYVSLSTDCIFHTQQTEHLSIMLF